MTLGEQIKLERENYLLKNRVRYLENMLFEYVGIFKNICPLLRYWNENKNHNG